MNELILQTGHAPVNGLQMYYEIHGTGEPLVLLHGGACTTAIFKKIMPAFSASRRVIAVDLQAHGRTADIDRPLGFETMADDIAALLKYLNIERADLLGYSLGGGVALRTTIQYPALVNKLIVVAFAWKRDGWFPEVRSAMVQFELEKVDRLKESPLYKVYAEVAPRPHDWPVLFQKLAALLSHEYDWSDDVAKIAAPTLLVFADADSLSPAHAAEFFGLLGGGKKDAGWDGAGRGHSQLAILPGTTHYNILASPLFPTVVTSFLADAKR